MSAYERPSVIYVQLTNIYPNPLNPRRDYRQNINDMKKTLLEQGWKEPLTVYEFGKNSVNETTYMLLSGHRRWASATEIHKENPKLMREVPCFVVAKPENDMEAIKSLAVHQSARKDWSVYEWAKMTYETWVTLGKPQYKELAYLIQKDVTMVGYFIDIFQTFPREEIETKLITEEYKIKPLFCLATWLRKFKSFQCDLYDQLGESMVRRLMLKKIDYKQINGDVLIGDRFVELATSDEMKEFLFSNSMTLKQCQASLGIEKVSGLYSNWKSDVQKITYVTKVIIEFPLSGDMEKVENFETWLDKLYFACKAKRKEIAKLKDQWQHDKQSDSAQ